MGDAKVRLNSAGVRKYLREQTGPAVAKPAQAIAKACGPGYVAVESVGKTRARAAVVTVTARARRDNSKNQTLLRNLNAGRRG